MKVEEALGDPMAENEPGATAVLPNGFLRFFSSAKAFGLVGDGLLVGVLAVHLPIAEGDGVVVMVPSLPRRAAEVTGERM